MQPTLKSILEEYKNLPDIKNLICHVLQIDKTKFITEPNLLLSVEQINSLQKLIIKRGQGVPLEYLTQTAQFFSLDLKVNEHTLIPRLDTEFVVEKILELFNPNKNLQVLELATGSGAISCALGVHTDWKITATDISANALAVAKENFSKYNLAINIIKSNWFTDINNKYDLIIANPPYIAINDPHLQKGDLLFEPKNALVADENGLADLKHIIVNAKQFLRANGSLVLEHGFDQHLAVVGLMQDNIYNEIVDYKDYGGNYRVCFGTTKDIKP